MTSKQISFAYPSYSQSYYAYMLNAITKKLISDDDRVYYCGPNYATRHGASSIIISINEARDKLNINKGQKLILWLQDCPYSKYKKLINNKNAIKEGDVILFAAPSYFGFNWKDLVDRGIKIDYLFYGYNEFYDLGIDFIKSKFKKENISKFMNINEINLLRIGSPPGIVNEMQYLQKHCRNPIIVFHGFYEQGYEDNDKDSVIPLTISSLKYENETFIDLLIRPKRIFNILKFIFKDIFSRYNLFIRKYEKNNYLKFRRFYRSFKGSLSNNEYLKKIQNHFRNKDIINDYSRFIEREQILNSMQSFVDHIESVKYSQFGDKKNTLLIGNGLISSNLRNGHSHLGSQEYEKLMGISLHTHCVIGNNTHGLGLHPRNLDAFITGNVVLHHLSPHSSGLGVLENHFTSKEFLAWENNYQLKNLIMKIVDEPTILEDIAINAYKKVKENHGWDKVANHLNKFL